MVLGSRVESLEFGKSAAFCELPASRAEVLEPSWHYCFHRAAQPQLRTSPIRLYSTSAAIVATG